MNNQLRAEWFKLQRNKTFWVLALISTGLSALLHYLVMIDWWQMHNTPFEHAGLSELNAMAAFTHPLYFIFYIGTLAGFFISNEFSQSGVIKNQIISGSKRRHIFLSKYLIFTLGSVIVTIVIPIMTAIIGILILGHGDIWSPSSMFYLGSSFGLFTLQFFGFTAIIMLIAIVTEDSGKTIIISIVFIFVMDAVRILHKPYYLSMIYENSIFHQFSEVFNYSMTSGEILKSILIAIATLTIFILCGVFVFNKKEIK